MAKSDRLRAARRIAKQIREQDPPEEVDVEKFTPVGQMLEPLLTEQHDRMTLIFQAHHEHIGDSPSSCDIRGSFLTETQEQPFFRRIKVTTEWQELLTGGIQNVGMVVIENLAGKNLRVNPTEEQKQEIEESILVVGYEHNEVDEVPPGKFVVIYPADVSTRQLKAARGSFEVKLYIFPR